MALRTSLAARGAGVGPLADLRMEVAVREAFEADLGWVGCAKGAVPPTLAIWGERDLYLGAELVVSDSGDAEAIECVVRLVRDWRAPRC